MNDYVIVSRHPAAIAFIRSSDERFVDAELIIQATADDVRGRHVAGNLPLHLAVLAKSMTAVEFDGPAPRGVEYTLDDMLASGARLVTYIVCDANAPSRIFELVASEASDWVATYAVRAMYGPQRVEINPLRNESSLTFRIALHPNVPE